MMRRSFQSISSVLVLLAFVVFLAPTVHAQEDARVRFYAASGEIQLSGFTQAIVLTGHPLTVSFSGESDPKEIVRVFLEANGRLYNMSNQFRATIGKEGELAGPVTSHSVNYNATFVPSEEGVLPLLITVQHRDGSTEVIHETVQATDGGRLLGIDGGTVAEGVVRLYAYAANEGWHLFDASRYGELNPQITNETGTFGWYVPPGEYEVRVEHPRLGTKRSGRVHVAHGVVAPTLSLVPSSPALAYFGLLLAAFALVVLACLILITAFISILRKTKRKKR